MTTILPPIFNFFISPSKASLRALSSSLTSILNAWNICFAGCPIFSNSFLGLLDLIISTKSNVVSIGLIVLLLQIFFSIF